MKRRSLALLIASACAMQACAPAMPGRPQAANAPLVLVTDAPDASPTPTPFQPEPASTAVLNILLTQMAEQSATPTETSTPEPPTVAPTTASTAIPTQPQPTTSNSGTRTLYTLHVSMDYAGREVGVHESVRYTNTTGQDLGTIVMAVEPNLWTNCFTLDKLSQDGTPLASYALDGQRLTITLPQPLAPQAVTTFSLGYNLSLPWKSGEGTFGYRSDQVNLTDWYPFIVPFEGDWLLHDSWSFGENLVYDDADYDVYVQVNDPNVILAASAPAEDTGDSTHYHLEGARTFVLSASDSYKVDETAVGSVNITAYYFAGHEDANKAVVWMATQSIGLYQVKFAPYPYPSLSIVESDLADGQEYDGLVFLASKFYTDYNGTAKSNLFTIGTHEISHQWWFGLVGSDQASEPWLDEALAVYSERIFYEYNYPAYGDWWWNFRVNYFGPSGYVDSSLYSFGTFRAYVNAVYLNGANFLDDLRTRVGDEAFFAFLQDYAASYAHERATGADLFAVLRRHTTKDFSDILGRYLEGQY
jgi:hypothetical protein